MAPSVTTLNFCRPPRSTFSGPRSAVPRSEVEGGQKGSDHVELSDHAEFFRDHAELPPLPSLPGLVRGFGISLGSGSREYFGHGFGGQWS